MKTCLIIAGGEYAPICPRPGEYIIACDRGYVYAQREGIRPQLLIGDFDSYCGALPEDIPVARFKKEKDDTDTMLAIRWAVDQAYDAVRISCALGGRLDHLYANIQSLSFAVKAGLEAEMADERTWLRALGPGEYTIKAREGWSLSLFALSESVEGLSISGSKYELENGRLEYSFPLGASNEFRGDACVRFESGMLLVICCRKED